MVLIFVQVFNKGLDSSEVKTQNPPPHFVGHFCYDASSKAVVGFLQEYSLRIKKRKVPSPLEFGIHMWCGQCADSRVSCRRLAEK